MSDSFSVPTAPAGATTPRTSHGRVMMMNAAILVAAWLLWDYPIMYPLKLLVVLMHETGHALAAILTGGSVESIEIAANQGGVTWTRGGSRIAILSAGYLGSTTFGLLLFYLSHLRGTANHVMEALGLAVICVAFWKVKWSDSFTLAFCMLTGGTFLFIGLKGWEQLEVGIARFVGVSSCLYAVFDIRDDLLHWGGSSGAVFVGGAQKSDAEALSEIIPLPAILWGAMWGLISLAAIFWVMSRLARLPASRLAAH